MAEADGRAIGILDLFVLADVAHGANIAVINNLVVDAGFRGRGIGDAPAAGGDAALPGAGRGGERTCGRTGTTSRRSGLYTACGFVDRGVLLELEL